MPDKPDQPQCCGSYFFLPFFRPYPEILQNDTMILQRPMINVGFEPEDLCPRSLVR